MEDDIRPFRDRLVGDAWLGEIRGTGFDVVGKTVGRAGCTISISVSFSMMWSPSARSMTSRSVSLRPIMPAAPVMRMCIPGCYRANPPSTRCAWPVT